MTTKREPAISRPQHPAEDLPERPKAAAPAPKAAGAPARPAGEGESYTEVINTRLRRSTRAALDKAVLIQQLRTEDRSHSIQSVVDAAIVEYIDRHNLRTT